MSTFNLQFLILTELINCTIFLLDRYRYFTFFDQNELKNLLDNLDL